MDAPLPFAEAVRIVTALEGEHVMAVVEGLGDGSRVSAHGPLRLVDFAGKLCFALGDGFTTALDPADFAGARHRAIGDGHFTLSITSGSTTLVLGDPDLLGSDYEVGP